MTMRFFLLASLFWTIACGNAEDIFKQGDAEQTRLYVHNELDGFFRNLESVAIRKTGDPAYGKNLILRPGSSTSTITIIEDNFWKTALPFCGMDIDIKVEVDNNADPVEETFEYIGLPVKCGEDYKFVIFEPTPPTKPYTSEGCMQTSSSASRAEDARIKTACGVGVTE